MEHVEETVLRISVIRVLGPDYFIGGGVFDYRR